MLKLLVAVIDAELLEAVHVENLEAVNVEHSDHGAGHVEALAVAAAATAATVHLDGAVDALHDPAEQPVVKCLIALNKSSNNKLKGNLGDARAKLTDATKVQKLDRACQL